MAGVDRLLSYAPRWLTGRIAQDVFGAVGAQLDDYDALDIGDQLFVATATWGLAYDHPNGDGTVTPTGWERDFGLPTIETDSLATRRARVLARIQGHAARTVADFAVLVQAMLLPPATCPPTTYTTAGLWVVFKPCDIGWVTNFLDVEAALALAGPAHLGLWLAPHRETPDTGLLDWQLDLMHGEAIDVLTDAEIDGTPAVPVAAGLPGLALALEET
jgi:hypothetical protein